MCPRTSSQLIAWPDERASFLVDGRGARRAGRCGVVRAGQQRSAQRCCPRTGRRLGHDVRDDRIEQCQRRGRALFPQQLRQPLLGVEQHQIELHRSPDRQCLLKPPARFG
jgi:hypothetical protein